MKATLSKVFALALIGCSGIGAAQAQMPRADTVKGAKDHPLLSRYAGSVLVGHSAKAFDAVDLPAGKLETRSSDPARPFTASRKVEGRFTRIAYNYPLERSSLEVMRNYEAALDKAGMKIQFACERATCGRPFGEAMLDRIGRDFKIADSTAYWEPFNHGRFEGRYLLASGKRSDGGESFAAVWVTAPVEGRNGGVYLEIVETQAMETGKVVADLSAADMARGLAADGRVALYGIYFATDKAQLEPASRPALAEMAKLLQSDPKLAVYIVGHTDNVGSLAHNTDLSQRRAEAVAAALAGEYKVDPKRLTARGVASLAPVASNDADAGRAKNRRVELVRQ